MEKKRVIFTFIFIIIFSEYVNAALGISPAIVEINFVPREEHEIIYSAISDNPEKELDIYVSGDLAEYAKLSTDKLIGPGNFKVKLKLPDKIEKPGMHLIGVGIKEKPSETEFIGTAINIAGIIKIFVPYPWRYVEATMEINNGNIDDEIPLEIRVKNMGKENLSVNIETNFFTEDGKFVDKMDFNSVVIESAQNRYFRKFLNTTGWRAGNYFGESIIDYGGILKINDSFKIGSLFVDVINFTDKLPQGGIQKFFINIESKWNTNIENVYADVDIINSTKTVSFRTPLIELAPWERAILTGYVDTTGMNGEYNTDIVLNFMGEKNSAKGRLIIFKDGVNYTLIIWGALGILILIIVILIIIAKRKRAFSYAKIIRRGMKK